MLKNLLLIIIGFFLLTNGADLLVEGASKIAKRFHISKIVIGLTIVAIGTSLPELVVSMRASIEEHSDIALGNVVGSNIANLLLILGICSIIKPIKIGYKVKKYGTPFIIFITTILLIFANTGMRINKIEGLFLLSLCILYITINIKSINKPKSEINNNKKENIFLALIDILLGILALKYGGEFVVDNAILLAKILNISEKIISVTIVAFSTSLPELFTSIRATRKNENDIALGNIMGSQILNILLVIGASAVVNSIEYSISYNIEIFLLLFCTIIFAVFPFINRKNIMNKKNGMLFLLIYGIYIILIVNNIY